MEKFLKELYTYDTLKIYDIIQIQLVFYCFIKYSEKRIIDDEEYLLESIAELYENFLDYNKSKIPELLEHLDETLERFIIQLAKTLDLSLKTEDDDLQTHIAKLLDEGVYTFLKETIPDVHLFYTKDNEIDKEKLNEIFKIDIIESEGLELETKPKLIHKAFHIRKKTLRKKNITPIKSRTKRFIKRTIKNRV